MVTERQIRKKQEQLKSSSGREAEVSAVQSYDQLDNTGLVAFDGNGMAWHDTHYSPKSLEP